MLIEKSGDITPDSDEELSQNGNGHSVVDPVVSEV